MEQDDMEKQFWFDDDKIWSFIQFFFMTIFIVLIDFLVGNIRTE